MFRPVTLTLLLMWWLMFVSSAYAALDVTGVIFSMIPLEAVAALILAALAGVWIIRKVLELVEVTSDRWEEYRIERQLPHGDNIYMDDYVDDEDR